MQWGQSQRDARKVVPWPRHRRRIGDVAAHCPPGVCRDTYECCGSRAARCAPEKPRRFSLPTTLEQRFAPGGPASGCVCERCARWSSAYPGHLEVASSCAENKIVICALGQSGGGVRRGAQHDLTELNNEPVFPTRTGLTQRMDELATVFRLIHPAAAAYAEHHSAVTDLLARCPISNLMPATTRSGPLTAAQLAAQSFPPRAGSVPPHSAGQHTQRPPGRPSPGASL